MSVAPDDPHADPEALDPGALVGEHVVEDVLGVGGFARVYRARHPVLGHKVAVKIITRALALDAGATQRFIREAQAASRIVHPNVVRVIGFGRLEDGRAYQTMELVEGLSLADHLDANQQVPLHEALAILEAVANALEAAHAAGIVHRDVKPANVLLDRAGGALRARLSDFGIAKALELEDAPNLTTTGVTLGTPNYMSPEQALARPVSPATDIYSFGVLAFELLTGKVPFEGESAFATMVMHVQTPPPLASTVCPELGSRFDAALGAMLAKHPADRPPTIGAALAALVGPPPAVVAVAKRRRRRSVTAGVLLVAAAAIALVVRARGHAEDPAAPSPLHLAAPVELPVAGQMSVREVAPPPTVTDTAPAKRPQPRVTPPPDAPQIDPADDIQPPPKYKL